MDDFFKDLKFSVYDRFRSPLITAFVLSWITWNFSTVVLFVGKGDFDKKIYMLGKIYNSNLSYFLNGLVFPMASSAAFILIYPFLARWSFLYWGYQHQTTKKKQVEIEDDTPMTMEDIKVMKISFNARYGVLELENERLQRVNQLLKENEAKNEEAIKKHNDNYLDKEKELVERNQVILMLRDELARSTAVNENVVKELEENKKIINLGLNYNLNKNLVDQDTFEDFLHQLELDEENISSEQKLTLLKINAFKDENNLDWDELKAITFVLFHEGKVEVEIFQDALKLSHINLKVIIDRLVKKNLLSLNKSEITFTDNGINRLFDSKLSKIESPDLYETLIALGVF